MFVHLQCRPKDRRFNFLEDFVVSLLSCKKLLNSVISVGSFWEVRDALFILSSLMFAFVVKNVEDLK